MKRVWMPVAFLVVAALALGAIAFIFSVNQQNWASTDNAELLAPTYQVVAPLSGRVTHWTSRLPGTSIAAGDAIGTIAGAKGSLALRAPHGGRFVGNYAFAGDLVAQGQTVALVADLHAAYVLAYVDESSAGSIRRGQTADLRFASAPQTLVVGRVTRVYPAVASITWPVPTLSTGQAFSKSAQWVPVRIQLPRGGPARYIGMSASVRIAIGGGGS